MKRKSKKEWTEIIAEGILLIILVPEMFNLSIFTGIGYILAIVGSLHNGLFFKKRNIGRMIFGGSILTYAAGKIFLEGMTGGDVITTLIIFAIAASIWIKGFYLKKGKEI